MVDPLDPLSPEPPTRPPGRRDLLSAGGAALLLYALLFNLSVVRGSSMAPGIHDGDRILVESWSYLIDDVARGDVVVLRSPSDPTVDYIKRVVGLPGDEVLVQDGRVWVNGEPLDEDYIVPGPHEGVRRTRVRQGHVFVLGDNRPRSADSRDFGQVPFELLRGRVNLCVWPPARVGLLR